MKNLVYALVGAGFMIACQPSDQPEISGMLTGQIRLPCKMEVLLLI